MLAMTVADQTEYVRYAPALAAAPFREGHLDRWSLASAGAIDFYFRSPRRRGAATLRRALLLADAIGR